MGRLFFAIICGFAGFMFRRYLTLNYSALTVSIVDLSVIIAFLLIVALTLLKIGKGG